MSEDELVAELDTLLPDESTKEQVKAEEPKQVASKPLVVAEEKPEVKPKKRGKFDINAMAGNIVKKKQDEVEEKFYDGFYKLMEKLANDEPIVQPASLPLRQVEVVEDNSKAIALIDEELLNPKSKNLESLYRVKQQLQGKPCEILDESPQQKKPPKAKGRITTNTAIAMVVLTVVLAVGTVITAGFAGLI